MDESDFDTAVGAPFRMRPGMRRLAAGTPQLTPSAPGSRHQREKLAVFTAFAHEALVQRPGFDPGPAVDAWLAQASAEHPDHLQWDGHWLRVPSLGTEVDRAGLVRPSGLSTFGHGDEARRCLSRVAPAWRLAALASLALREDVAIVDGRDGTIPWIAVALPSHWAPASKVGQHFAAVHAPVADNELIIQASEALVALVTGTDRWERFVWAVTDHPRLHAHPERVDPADWHLPTDPAALAARDPFGQDPVTSGAWLRHERQTFIPVPGHRQAVFTIRVAVDPLDAVASTPARAARLRDAIASMSPAVLAYRGLEHARDGLVTWLDQRARAASAP
jgi:dimethylamine monooxygenase subunit A